MSGSFFCVCARVCVCVWGGVGWGGGMRVSESFLGGPGRERRRKKEGVSFVLRCQRCFFVSIPLFDFVSLPLISLTLGTSPGRRRRLSVVACVPAAAAGSDGAFLDAGFADVVVVVAPIVDVCLFAPPAAAPSPPPRPEVSAASTRHAASVSRALMRRERENKERANRERETNDSLSSEKSCLC